MVVVRGAVPPLSWQAGFHEFSLLPLTTSAPGTSFFLLEKKPPKSGKRA